MDNIETIDEDDCDGNKTLDNQFYECLVIDGHNKRFVCKYENCEQTEIDESVMINHLSLHLVQDLVDNDNDINDIQCQEEEEKQIDFRVVIDLSEESNNSNDCENTDNLLPKVDINSLNNGWEQWIQRKQIDSKDIHFCNWSDCHFETDLRIKLKRHIMNKHLNDKTDTNIQKTDSICHQIFNHNESVVKFECNSEISRNTAKYEKSKTAAKDMNKLNDMPIEMKNNDNSKFESFVSNLIDVSVGQNGRLSLKGMASVKKLKDHIDCKVVDGVKWYYCRYNDKCNYRSKRGQALCIHIHTAHIGVYLKCFQTNCGKIFRTATSWREHQKCHVCNFGCKGVTGVCSNRNINKYREKVVTDTNIKAYRCKWSDCNTTTVHSSGIRRHIHNTHICPYYNSDVWKDKFNESLQSCDDNNNNISNDYIIKPKQQQKQYLCHNNGCKLSFYNEVELRRHEKLFCELRKFSQKSAINNKRGFTKNKNNKNNEGYGNYKSIVKTNKNSLNIVKQKQKLSKNVTKNESKITKSLNNINDCQTSKTQVNDITTNYHQINQLINNKDIDPKCQKYVDISIFNGDDYFLCKYYDCKFSTKIVSKINEHIIRLHLGLNRIPNNEMNLRLRKQANNMTPEESSNQLDLSCGHTSDNNRKSFNFKSLTIPLKRIHSLHENKNDYKVKRQKICNKNNPINKPQETVNRELRSKIKRTADKLKKVSVSDVNKDESTLIKITDNSHNHNKCEDMLSQENDNINNDKNVKTISNDFIKNNYEIKLVDSLSNFFCKYDIKRCRYYGFDLQEIEEHIRDKHLAFCCDINNCTKEFKNQNLLDVHKRNHKCGFGIKGMKPTGVCALNNIRKFREEKVFNNQLLYSCLWKHCSYITEDKNMCLMHVHNRHICLNRPKH